LKEVCLQATAEHGKWWSRCDMLQNCSWSVQRRLKKLGRRRLRVGYREQTVCETKRNADAFETLTLLDDGVSQRGMMVPGHEDTCKPAQPACNLFVMELSASVIGIFNVQLNTDR